MAKKPGFTLEQHKQLAIELKTITEKLLEIGSDLSRAYPFKMTRFTNKAEIEIRKLRTLLDDKVIEENPDVPKTAEIYFPLHHQEPESPTER